MVSLGYLRGARRRRNRAVRLGQVVAVAAILGLVPGWLAAQQSPVEVIRARNTAVEKILAASGETVDATTRERLKDVINGSIDFTELSKRSLGNAWNDRTEQERQQFTDVFRRLVRNTSVKKLEAYKYDRVDYSPATITGTTARVATVAHKGAKSAQVVYLMHQVGKEWKVYDVVIDGASTVRSYRDSFSREIAKTSYAQMYDRLVRRANES